LPLVFWGHVGLCLYYLEKDIFKKDEPELLDEPEEEGYTEALVQY